ASPSRPPRPTSPPRAPMPRPMPMPMPIPNPTSGPSPEVEAPAAERPEAPDRPPCPAPADFRAEVAAYDRAAEVATWAGHRHRMTYRTLGQGPPLIVIPGIAATYRGYALMLNRLAGRFRTVVFDY